MIMLPIPVPIIGSNKRLFIPLIYIAVTATFCYIFLITLIKFSPTHRKVADIKTRENFIFKINLNNQNPQKKSLRQTQAFAKFKREVDTDSFFDAYSTLHLSKGGKFASSFDSWRSKKKKPEILSTPSSAITKSLENFTVTTNHKNGARRSYPSQIWIGHQDLNWSVDELAPSLQPWPQDQQCSRFHTHFAKKKTFKPRALVSFPGSGNSWLRYLIECSTGIFTGSVFNDSKIYSTGLLGEFLSPNDGSTIVQKTHHDALRFSSFKSKQAYVKLTELMFGYRGILLIRNPYDALISYWNFVETRDHKELASQKKFNPYKWQHFVLTLIPKWSSMITSWVDNSQSLLIVEYEKLKKNPHYEILRILGFLDQPVDEERLRCLLKKDHIKGPFQRRHKDKNQNSFSTNNPFFKTGESETKEKEKNLSDYAQALGQNSKSWRNDSILEQNISPNRPLLLSSLDLIVQDNINHINRFFSEKYIPIFLNYKGPTSCCTL